MSFRAHRLGKGSSLGVWVLEFIQGLGFRVSNLGFKFRVYGWGGK